MSGWRKDWSKRAARQLLQVVMDYAKKDDLQVLIDEYEAHRAEKRREKEKHCPSCGCVVDKNGHGHHSAADCIFMHINDPDPAPEEPLKPTPPRLATAAEIDAVRRG
jgi:UDP-N-acetylenolpyruvoylglucosamine reductase